MNEIILEFYNERIEEYEKLYKNEKNSYMKIHIFAMLREMKFARFLLEQLADNERLLNL